MITKINEFKKYLNDNLLNEKIQSDILRTIVNSDLVKKVKRLDSLIYGGTDWASLKDEDFVQITPKQARTKQYENTILFWFKDSKLIATSNGKSIYHSDDAYRVRVGGRRGPGGYGRYGRTELPSSKAIADESDSVFALINTHTDNRRSIRAGRDASKSGALAFQDPNTIAEENRTRYRTLLAKKKTANDNIDDIVKKFMDKYSQQLTAVSMPTGDYKNDVYSSEEGSFGQMKKTVSSIQKRMHNLLDKYERYLYITRDIQKGSIYAHQNTELNQIRKKFEDWDAAGEVDEFDGSMQTTSHMDYLRNKRR